MKDTAIEAGETSTAWTQIPAACAGMRLDRALASLLADHSRTAIQRWIRQGRVLVDEEIPNQKDRVSGGERVELLIPDTAAVEYAPQPVALDVVAADEHLLVIAKPVGLVVHPGAGNPDGTLLNGLLYRYPEQQRLPRAGIVHRLDKNTSGLMVVARTEGARLALIEQLADRRMGRVYQAVVKGVPVSGGRVAEPIGRDPRDRRRMAVAAKGKEAITHYRVMERYRRHTLLECRLATGRTHQIRVHLRHIGLPIVGDGVYGARPSPPPDAAPQLRALLSAFPRQALHAIELSLEHPASGKACSWRCPLPPDIAELVGVLREDRQQHD